MTLTIKDLSFAEGLNRDAAAAVRGGIAYDFCGTPPGSFPRPLPVELPVEFPIEFPAGFPFGPTPQPNDPAFSPIVRS
jgi:hypothetical protein